MTPSLQFGLNKLQDGCSCFWRDVSSHHHSSCCRSSNRGCDWNVLKIKNSITRELPFVSVQGSTFYVNKHVVVIEIFIQVHHFVVTLIIICWSVVTARRIRQGLLCERRALLQCSTGQPALSGRGKTHTARMHTQEHARLPRLLPRPLHACLYAAPRRRNKEGGRPLRQSASGRTGRLAQCPASVGRRGGPSSKAQWGRLVTHACRQHGHGHAYPLTDYSPITSSFISK